MNNYLQMFATQSYDAIPDTIIPQAGRRQLAANNLPMPSKFVDSDQSHLALDTVNNVLYISEVQTNYDDPSLTTPIPTANRIRKLDLATLEVTTVIGDDSYFVPYSHPSASSNVDPFPIFPQPGQFPDGFDAKFTYISDLAVDAKGDLLVADYHLCSIRKVILHDAPSTKPYVITVAGGGFKPFFKNITQLLPPVLDYFKSFQYPPSAAEIESWTQEVFEKEMPRCGQFPAGGYKDLFEEGVGEEAELPYISSLKNVPGNPNQFLAIGQEATQYNNEAWWIYKEGFEETAFSTGFYITAP